MEDVCKTIYYTTGISVSLLDGNHQKTYSFGVNANVDELFEDIFDDFKSYVDGILAVDSNIVYTYSTRYELSYITALLTHDNIYHGALLIGPVLLNETSEHLINEIIQKGNISLSTRRTLKDLYHQMPIVHTPRNHYIYKMVASLIASPFSNELAATTYDSNQSLDAIDRIDTSQQSELANHNYSFELLFMTKVASGDVDKVVELYNEHLKTQYFTRLAPEQLRSAKNNAIVLSTLLARAAINGGVESDKALTLGDIYVNKIESVSHFEDLMKLTERMIIKFTNSVLQLSSINHVSVIKNASKYVHLHLSEVIRLNDVADYVNLSPNYFSSLFKREMNISFADYVNQTRIKESQFLLETTNYTILDIAIAVGYNNQNYFTTIFRKFTDITPKQYRMRSAK